MALKSSKTPMKVVGVLVILIMVLSAGYTGYGFLINYIETNKTEFVYNNAKEKQTDFNILKASYKDLFKSYANQSAESKKIDKKDQKEIFTDEVITSYVLKEKLDKMSIKSIAKEYKIAVDKKEVSAEYKKILDQVGGESQLSIILYNRGLTISKLKEDIEYSLLQSKLAEKISEHVNVSDKELETYYEAYKSKYDNKSFDEVKNEVKKDYVNPESAIQSLILTKLEKNPPVFEDKDLETIYNKLQEVVIPEFNVKLYTLYPNIVNSMALYVPYDEAYSKVLNNFKERTDLFVQYKENMNKEGFELSKDFISPYDYTQYYILAKANFVKNYKASDKDLEKAFEDQRYLYDIEKSSDGLIIYSDFTPTEADDKLALDKANEILKEVNKDNFSELADKYSSDKASKGGNLGSRDISAYVEGFKNAVKGKKAGELLGPVKSQYGYHIIYVVSVDEKNPDVMDLKHILIKPEASDNTKKEILDKLFALKDKLENNKITLKNIDKYKNDFTGYVDATKVEEYSTLNTIGYVPEVNDKILSMNVDTVDTVTTDKAGYLIKKTGQTEAKKATFEEYKEKVRVRLAESVFANQ